MRAVKDSLHAPSGEGEELEDPRWTRAVRGFSQGVLLRVSEDKEEREWTDSPSCSRNAHAQKVLVRCAQ